MRYKMKPVEVYVWQFKDFKMLYEKVDKCTE